MQPRTFTGRLLCYLLLLVGSLLFAFPFAWMIATSLKPIEQAAKLPPEWIPHDYHAYINGRYVQVVRGDPLTQPMLVVQVEEGPRAGTKALVSLEEYQDGKALIPVANVPTWQAARRMYRTEVGWHFIKERTSMEELDAPAEWEVLPPERIDSRARLFWENYPNAIRKMGMQEVRIPFVGVRTIPIFWLYLRNTLMVCVLGVAGTLVSCSLAAYSLARIPWRGRGALFAVTLATMMVPFPVLMVPLYGLFKWLGWVGTLLPLWVPAFFGSGFNIFLLRQFFLTIPRELSDAARIDGCSELGILWRIILPLSIPALAVVALFHVLYAWNDFMGPLLYLGREETFTLSLGLQHYQAQHGGADWTSMMAASTLVCLPIVVLFLFTQKTFIRGIATHGIKG